MSGHCAEGRWITMESARINDAWRTASASTSQGGSRPFNFGAGPGALPQAVLAKAAEEMQDWRGCGMGVMEMSHRGRDFMTIYEEAVAGLRRLLAVPPEFHILFQQGGGIGQNAMVPLNLGAGGAADFVLTGSWSEKSHIEAGKYLERAGVAASARVSGYCGIPAAAHWQLDPQAAYVQICSNETIQGVQFDELPDLAALGSSAPLVVDCSSDIASRPMDWSRVGMAFAGAQKNLGPAGLTVVFVRDDLLGRAQTLCPDAFNYSLAARHQSMINTPPTWGIYILGLMVSWIASQQEGQWRGLAAMERRHARQAQTLYAAIDAGSCYQNRVDRAARSRMNVPFFLTDARREGEFLAGAAERGLLQLKGHASVGGMRASLYNAMSDAGVQALVEYLRDFERRTG